MSFARSLTATLLLISVTCAAAPGWHPYPVHLPQFDYQGDKLKQAWPQLTQATFIAYPSAANLRAEAQRFPALEQYSRQQASQNNAHPALKAALDGNYQPLSEAIAQVWRFHFEGDFQQAYQLGSQLGPAGFIPALYSRLMHTALLEPDKQKRLAVYREVSALSAELLPKAPDHAFALFGLAYAHARELELLGTSEATATGYLSETRDTLEQLQQQYPQRALYPAMLGGLHAGVVERVGSFIGRVTYGSSESAALQAFSQALELESDLPVILNEYAKALIRLDEEEYADQIRQVLQRCAELPVYSAEEALNRDSCQNRLSASVIAGN